MSRNILIVSPDIATTGILREKLSREGPVATFDRFSSAYDSIYSEIPAMLIVDMGADSETVTLLNILKDDPLFSSLPVLAVLDDTHCLPDWKNVHVDDYIWRKDIESEIATKVELCTLRSRRIVEVNPLTRLPGNISINNQIQNRLDRGESFALAYTDLDYFKPYNDTYGFSRGDDVLRITGRLLLNITKSIQPQDSFVGHIGGDDFVCIADPSAMEDICKEVITAFDRIIPNFYDPADRQAGCIRGHDRAGRERDFPFLGISIGVVFSGGGPFTHYGEITEIAAEVKSFAKRHEGSCYRFNRRDYTLKSP